MALEALNTLPRGSFDLCDSLMLYFKQFNLFMESFSDEFKAFILYEKKKKERKVQLKQSLDSICNMGFTKGQIYYSF